MKEMIIGVGNARFMLAHQGSEFPEPSGTPIYFSWAVLWGFCAGIQATIAMFIGARIRKATEYSCRLVVSSSRLPHCAFHERHRPIRPCLILSQIATTLVHNVIHVQARHWKPFRNVRVEMSDTK